MLRSMHLINVMSISDTLRWLQPALAFWVTRLPLLVDIYQSHLVKKQPQVLRLKTFDRVSTPWAMLALDPGRFHR
jgi:hypothetical protein